MYALFDNLDDFNEWHDSVKVSIGLPMQRRRPSGELIPGSFQNNYTSPIVHSIAGTVIAPFDERANYDGVTMTHEEATALGYFTESEE
jgi:hypothetical protein